jgi:hypothetical protein
LARRRRADENKPVPLGADALFRRQGSLVTARPALDAFTPR